MRVAQLAEQCGVAAIAIHGRTRAERFSGQAEYVSIAAVKSMVGIPVIANGDISTPQQARAVLPASYSREDAVFNVQRSALLIAALATGTTSAFPAALQDRIHQPYRAPLVPGLEEILRLRAPGLLGSVLSGAGPSILVFYERGHESVTDLIRQIFAHHGHASEVLMAGIADHGYERKEIGC